ncbi:MAG: HlyD family efflux transporter periplasmic adaptor subunit [Cyanobacteria bacterium J06614_10]
MVSFTSLRNKSTPTILAVAVLSITAVAIPFVGLRGLVRSPAATQAPIDTAARPVKVVALGRIRPMSGVIQVGGPINEILERLLVSEGTWVDENQVLGYLRSYRERVAELEQAQKQLQIAQEQLQAELLYGQAQVEERLIDSGMITSVDNRGIASQQALIESLVAEQSLARREFERYRQLLVQGAISESALDQRAAEVDQITQRIRQEEERLEQLINERDRTLANAEAQIALTQINLNRVQANSDVEAAQEAVELAEVRVEDTIIRAPQSGRILRVTTQPGEGIGDEGRSKGSILEMANTRRMKVVAEVNAADIQLIEVGQSATITSPNGAFDEPLAGAVVAVGNQIYRNDLLSEDPSARSDTRVIEVDIELYQGELVQQLTNLQVQAEISLVPPASEVSEELP